MDRFTSGTDAVTTIATAIATAIGAVITGPVVLLLILGIVAVINVVLICRIGAAWDKACADLIDAKTDEIVDKYKVGK